MATATLPILASTLYTRELHSKTTNIQQSPSLDHSDQPPQPRPTSQSSLSSLFAINSPSLTCLSTPGPSTLSPALTLHLTTTHLLSSPTATTTAILDATNNSFDVRKLRDAIMRELQGEDVKAQALEILKRVTLMRVFDFVGTGESLGEVRESLEDRRRKEGNGARRRRWEVENEVEDSEGSEEDLMFQGGGEKEREEGREQQSSSLLLIDNFSHLIAPVLKKDLVQGQAVLHSFLRSLRHLTLEFGVATLLVTDADARPTSVNRNETVPSIFASCSLKPGLGMGVGSWLDLYLLVHLVPRTAQDARTVYGTQQQGEQRQRAAGQMVTVVEVLLDRFGERLGRWVALETGQDGELKEIA